MGQKELAGKYMCPAACERPVKLDTVRQRHMQVDRVAAHGLKEHCRSCHCQGSEVWLRHGLDSLVCHKQLSVRSNVTARSRLAMSSQETCKRCTASFGEESCSVAQANGYSG